MARNSQRGRRNNNPEGRNQYSNSWMDTARERPMAAAATAAAAVGAGVFLWSRRNQISDQLSNLSDQISEWTENMRSGNEGDEFETADSTGSTSGAAIGSTSSRTSRSTGSRSTSTKGSGGRSTREMSETGGGNASFGAHTGSGGSTVS
jgi:hypothetical protein